MRTQTVAAAILTIAMLACAKDPGPNGQQADQPASGGAAQPSQPTNPDAPLADSDPPNGDGVDVSAEFAGEEFGVSQQELSEHSEAMEVAIGECMSAAGFEYIAVDFASISWAMSHDKSAPGSSRSQFVEQYGLEDATYAFALETENFSRTGGCTRSAVAQFLLKQK